MQAGLKSSLIMQEESTSARAGTLASDWYYLGRVRSFDEIQAAIDALTPRGIVEHVRALPAQGLHHRHPGSQTVIGRAPRQLSDWSLGGCQCHFTSKGLITDCRSSAKQPSARSVALGFFVRTGSRDETADVSGVTHFLEHMVFKGTPRRSALDVNRDFDRIGAHYNAFTSEENTVFYAAILPEYLPQAVDILADILRPSLRTDDFDMEKNVIIEEIGMYEDQPMWSAYDSAKRVYFGEHPLGNSILGTPDSIRALTRDQMHAYFERRYVAPNITVVAAGRFDWPDFVREVESRCAGWNTGPTGRREVREAGGAGAKGSDESEGFSRARRSDLPRSGGEFASPPCRRHPRHCHRRRLRQPALLGPGRSWPGRFRRHGVPRL